MQKKNESTVFHIGDTIQVAYEEGSIHISLANPIQPSTIQGSTASCQTE